jgi:class 3 adenylate cyclase
VRIVALESCIPGLRGEQVPLILFIRLYELLASVTMQFEGFIYRFVERRGQYLVVFSSPKDAICFCHATQMLLMQELWPSEAVSWCGDIEKTADDKLLYKGPRLAMVVHNSNNYTLQHQKSNFLEDDLLSGRLLQSRRDIFVDYVGSVEQEMKILSEIAHGGQVILTEAAWQAAQDQLPGKPQVISLGKHQINNSLIPNPMILMEVMPHPLSKRIFPPPRNTIIMEPSYYDAPSADTDVTIVYMKVAKPMKVFEAECANAASSRLSRSEKVLEAYIKALELTMATARSLLQTFNGYECKEVEREKATFAFRNLETGVRWAASLQLELSKAEWPDEVLTWDDCRVGVNAVPRLCTGLKVHAGIACGIPSSKAPLKTGRADYYGTVPNLAARLMALSQPGQILIDGAKLSTLRGAATVTDDELILLPKCENKPFHTEALIIPIGQVAIKGLEDFRIVYHVVPSELRGTDFQEPAGLVQRTTMHSFVRRALAGRELSRSSNSLHQEGNGADFASESMSSKNDPHPNVFASLFIMEDSFTGNTVRKGRGFSLFRSTSKFSDNSDGSTTLLDSVHRLQAKEDQDSSMEAGTNRKS